MISQEEVAVAVQFLGKEEFKEELLENVTVCAGGLDVPSAAVNVRVGGHRGKPIFLLQGEANQEFLRRSSLCV